MERAGRKQASVQEGELRMKLLRLTLHNFMGIRDFTLSTDGGKNVRVMGDNSTGKTTLFSAITWLLFGKNADNQSTFDIKTLTLEGEPLHNLEHSVEAEFEVNGKSLVLKKIFKEKWTQKRGSITKEFSGHLTDCYVNEVPVKASEYANKIASICDEETFKLLTSPTYFNTQLHWQKRREVLLQVCGDVSDGDVIASSKELAELPQILGDRSIDDHRKVIAASRKKINDELQKIPVRIDEAERGLPDVVGLNIEKLTLAKGSLNVQLVQKQAEISRIKNGGEVAEKTKQLRELESKLLDIKNTYRAVVNEQVDGKQQELNKLKTSIGTRESQLKMTERSLKNNEEAVKDYEVEAEKMRQQWHEVNSREFTFEQDGSCPACGQALPANQLDEAREKALAAFNRQKAGLLEEISTKGKKCKANSDVFKAEAKEIQADIEVLKIDIYSDQNLADQLQVEIDTISASASDPKDSPEYKESSVKLEILARDIDDLQSGTRELLVAAQEEEHSIKAQIQSVDDDLQKLRMREQGEARIKELAAEEKKLAKEFERLEKELFLTEQFTRAKVNLLEDKINSKFKYARFRLFEDQINGGLSEVCEATYGGVPYSTGLNRGHKIIVGMDIISTLSEHYKFAPVIFVDDAESVTRLPEMKAQVIRLVKPEIDTSEKAKKYSKLVVDVEGEQNTLFGE